MGRKSKFTTNEKLEYVLRCIDREDSINHTAKLIGVNRRTLSDWIRNYQSLGIDGLNITFKNTSYSEKTKNMSVRDYIDGKGSLDDICKKYG
ncbi:helix-turn-helix domain-containing protein, partial [Maledivibacter halophilus]